MMPGLSLRAVGAEGDSKKWRLTKWDFFLTLKVILVFSRLQELGETKRRKGVKYESV